MIDILAGAETMLRELRYSVQWFCIDKSARICAGAGIDGMFAHERSQADWERLHNRCK